ncbi:MAG: adenylate/guanylate cyclase domain-containing protein [Deltaproteobacteria bacterium]|nr:MAG: adenylate/guanylate cyclase domain-containing protein [Deltaproteobacteria bacterium]
MTKLKLLRLKNAMLMANAISNLIGVCVVIFLGQVGSLSSPEILQLTNRINLVFIPCAFILPVVLTIRYENSIRRYLEMAYLGEPIPEDFKVRVHQRLLNEPFFLIALDLAIWITAAVLYPVVFWAHGATLPVIVPSFFLSLYTGLITVTVAFFVFEFVLQKRVVPHFFPNGGLYMTPKTIRIRIRTRIIAFLFACNLVPFLAILNALGETLFTDLGPATILQGLRSSMFANSLIFMGVGIWLAFLVSSNLTRPLQEIIRVLRRVRYGDFDKKVGVTTNDEIGYTGDVINEMNKGLKEREFIKETFGKYVAQEVRDEVLSGRVPLDGEMKEVTILFADLQDFTPMTESHDPKFVVKIMNSYFEEMADAIQQEGGLVLQFLGDEIYAVFGAPISRADHPERAFRAAVAMNQRLVDLNSRFSIQGWPTLRHGIGIHTGEAVAANIGSPDRLSYLLMGDTVNLASRLQGLTKDMGEEIIISEATRVRLEDDFPLKRLPAVKVKGKSKPVEIFALT